MKPRSILARFFYARTSVIATAYPRQTPHGRANPTYPGRTDRGRVAMAAGDGRTRKRLIVTLPTQPRRLCADGRLRGSPLTKIY